ncbi:hypothetical protein [Thiomicrospira sp.]|uniref:hypothetical protein n=1 Tax=Thiomicrospira sp. TaxID=935 RepID=UPI002F94B690
MDIKLLKIKKMKLGIINELLLNTGEPELADLVLEKRNQIDAEICLSSLQKSIESNEGIE